MNIKVPIQGQRVAILGDLPPGTMIAFADDGLVGVLHSVEDDMCEVIVGPTYTLVPTENDAVVCYGNCEVYILMTTRDLGLQALRFVAETPTIAKYLLK